MTVSLDWLEKIAEVFEVPAAALLMSHTTTGIPVLGEVLATGQVIVSATPAVGLGLVIAAPNPVAIRTKEGVRTRSTDQGFEADTLLIGSKIDRAADTAIGPQDSIVAFACGGIVLCRAAVDGGQIVVDSESHTATVNTLKPEWIAPILMAVRYC